MIYTTPSRDFRDLSGLKINSLLVISPLGSRKGSVFFLVRCDCGREVHIASRHLSSERRAQRTCGRCVFPRKAHGRSARSEYKIWRAMIRRCRDPKFPGYKDYGARGIYVCESWIADIDRFLADMGPRPSNKHSIERINNDGPYVPDNCCWATPKEQSRNRRRTHLIEWMGRKGSLKDWSEWTGINYGTLFGRFHRGWPTERLLSR